MPAKLFKKEHVHTICHFAETSFRLIMVNVVIILCKYYYRLFEK